MNSKKYSRIFSVIQIIGWLCLFKSIVGLVTDIHTNLNNSAAAFSSIAQLASQSILATAIAIVICIGMVGLSSFLGIKIEQALPSVPVMPRTMDFKMKDFVLTIVKTAITINGAFSSLSFCFSICNNTFVAFANVFAIFVAPFPFSLAIVLKFTYLQMYLSVMAIIVYAIYLISFKSIFMAKGYDDIVKYTYNSLYFCNQRKLLVTGYLWFMLNCKPRLSRNNSLLTQSN